MSFNWRRVRYGVFRPCGRRIAESLNVGRIISRGRCEEPRLLVPGFELADHSLGLVAEGGDDIRRRGFLPRSEELGGQPRNGRLHDRPTLAPRVTRSSSSCSNVPRIPPFIPAMAPSRAYSEG